MKFALLLIASMGLTTVIGDCIRRILPCAPSIVFDGESTTSGISSQLPSYPTQLCAQLPANYSCYNSGTGGAEIADLIAEGVLDVDMKRQGPQDHLVLWIGVNDLIRGGPNAAATYAGVSQYIAARKAAGWTVVILTLPPMTALSFPGADSQAMLDADTAQFNALILANTAGADVVLDISADPFLQPGAGGRQPDGIHYNVAGNARIADLVLPSLQRLCP